MTLPRSRLSKLARQGARVGNPEPGNLKVSASSMTMSEKIAAKYLPS